MARILLGVSGSIAAYKALEFVRLATAAGHSIRVVQTPTSRRFVGESSFAALSGAPVLMSEFERDPVRGAFPGQAPPAHDPLSHLEFVGNAELLLIAPASANTIAKLAAGLADNLLSSCALAATCPVLIAPAMNDKMYEHPATRANVATLRERGVRTIEPEVGSLASRGEQGIGRMAEPARLLGACESALADASALLYDEGVQERPGKRLQGVRVLITAGGTREPIDSVRFIGNSSSGRMGLALAQGASARGADVMLVAANVALPMPPGIPRREVSTAAELQRACEEEFPACEVLLMAAAVADFRPASRREGKISKSGHAHLELELEPTTDVLAALAGKRRTGQTLVGFAAEHGEGAIERGREKLAAKSLDAVIVNDISRSDIGFDVDANEVTILTAAGYPGEAGGTSGETGRSRTLTSNAVKVGRASKAHIAEEILNAVERLRAGA